MAINKHIQSYTLSDSVANIVKSISEALGVSKSAAAALLIKLGYQSIQINGLDMEVIRNEQK